MIKLEELLELKKVKIGIIFLILLISVARPYLKGLDLLSLLGFPFSVLIFRSLFLLGSYLDETLPYNRFVIGWVGFYFSIVFALVFLFCLYKFLKKINCKIYLKQMFFFFTLFQFIKATNFIYLVIKMRSSPWRGLFMLIFPPHWASFIIPFICIYNIIMIARNKDNSISLSFSLFIMYMLSI